MAKYSKAFWTANAAEMLERMASCYGQCSLYLVLVCRNWTYLGICVDNLCPSKQSERIRRYKF